MARDTPHFLDYSTHTIKEQQHNSNEALKIFENILNQIGEVVDEKGRWKNSVHP
jgi:hypothetical protein